MERTRKRAQLLRLKNESWTIKRLASDEESKDVTARPTALGAGGAGTKLMYCNSQANGNHKAYFREK